MAKTVAIIIAVEEYRDKTKVPNVQYASRDAQEMETALKKLGVADVTLLINQQATKNSIQLNFRRTLAGIASGDTLYIFYAGHGFQQNKTNFITCWDYSHLDAAGSSIRLKYFYDKIQSVGCNGILLIDACHSGMKMSAAARAIVQPFSSDQLAKLFENSEHCAVFSACKDSEWSWSDGTLKHGVWTHFVLQTFTGQTPELYLNDRYLTNHALQDYLALNVTPMVKNLHNATQTPRYAGTQNNSFVVADLLPITAAKTILIPAGISQITFSATEQESVSGLSGFNRKWHQVYDKVTIKTREFVQSIAAQEISDDIERCRQRLAKSGLYDWSTLHCEEYLGTGSIETPDFTYFITVEQDEDNAHKATFERTIENISDFAVITKPTFNTTFKDMFECLKVSHTSKADVKAIVKAIELKKISKELSLFVEKDGSWIRITVPKSGQFVIDASETWYFSNAGTPHKLFENFFGTTKLMRENYGLNIMPFTLSVTK